MRDAKHLDTNDVKEIIAERFGVPVDNVIKAQYTYTVILPEKAKEDIPDAE